MSFGQQFFFLSADAVSGFIIDILIIMFEKLKFNSSKLKRVSFF